jgi:hypothetical protein
MSQTKAQLIDNLVQPITGALGSASAPTFSFTSDPNTGVYSPGADQLALSTGGTGRLFIDASGRVGINKTALSQTLHVQSTSGGTTARFENSSSGNFIDFYETSGGTRMGYVGHVTATDMYLHNDKNGPIIFNTNNTERMRLDSSGRLGLGTSSPGEKLDIAGGAIRLNSTHGIYKANSDGYLYLSGGTGLTAGGVIFAFAESHSTNANEIHFRNSGNTTRAVIDASGRVGIGTASPSGTLHVIGTSIRFSNVDNASYYGSITHDANVTGANIYNSQDTGGHIFQQSGSEKIRIDSSGRFLVGTSSAGAGSTQTVSIIGSTLIQSTGLQSLSSGGTLDLDLFGTGIVGHLYVTSTLTSNAASRTNSTYFITTRLGNATVITLLNSANGSTSGKSFSITNPSGNVFRFTDTSASACTVSMSFVGAIAY